MIKKISIQSRKQIENILKTCKKPIELPWALISIWNSHELLDFENIETLNNIGCRNFLSIRFADLTKKELEKLDIDKKDDKQKDYKLFDEIDAQKIIDFIVDINKKDIPVLIIHCAAGISRSGAIGLFICRYFDLDEEQFREENKYILPNFYILNVLNNVSKINDDYVKFWETQKNLAKRQIMFNLSYGKQT